jgi:hypothetical protein
VSSVFAASPWLGHFLEYSRPATSAKARVPLPDFAAGRAADPTLIQHPNIVRLLRWPLTIAALLRAALSIERWGSRRVAVAVWPSETITE